MNCSKQSPDLSTDSLTKPAIHILVGDLIDDVRNMSQSQRNSCSNNNDGSKSLHSNNTILSTEYGKMDSVLDLQKVLSQKCAFPSVQIHSITLATYQTVIKQILLDEQSTGIVIFNLCDGTESDGYPGISVNNMLENLGLPYTGADAKFFDATTSKIYLKSVLMAKGVSTSPFLEIHSDSLEQDLDQAEIVIGDYPLIVKPSVSYASLGISDKSIVYDRQQAKEQTKNVLVSCDGGVFMERFLPGREFTALVLGDVNQGIKVFTVAERVFNPKLAKEQRILAFDRYWQGYDLQGNAPKDEEKLYHYQPAPASLQKKLTNLALDAYIALDGRGYGRIDMRSDCYDENVMKIYVLEVNANCGLSFDSSSSMGEILQMSREPVDKFVENIIQVALGKFSTQQANETENRKKQHKTTLASK